MNKILQATSRGQITLPKQWRDKFSTNYYLSEIKDSQLIIKPLMTGDEFKDKVEKSWQQYLDGDYIGGEDLTKKYGL